MRVRFDELLGGLVITLKPPPALCRRDFAKVVIQYNQVSVLRPPLLSTDYITDQLRPQPAAAIQIYF